MSTPNCTDLGPQDSLSRDGTIPAALDHGRPAFKIVVGALIVLLLALAGSLSPEPQSTVDRLELPREAPAIEFDGHGKWGGYAR